MESTLCLLSVVQARNTLLDNSANTPAISPPRNHPSLPDDGEKICLRLQTWANVLNEPLKTLDEQRGRVQKILEFFVKVGTLNNLHDTPSVQSLKNALSVLSSGGNELFNSSNDQWKKKISQLSSPAKTDFERIANLRELIIHGVPLFNIWDCISFLYTVCAEEIKTSVNAQLHLVQFRIIIKALRQVKEYFPHFAGPTTVAATWTTLTEPQPLTVAFATTCVGRNKSKANMADDRKKFMETITSQLKNIPPPAGSRYFNKAGNCPEFITWGITCREEGKYTSLCFNMEDDPKAKVYQCCGRCEDMLRLLGANNIDIKDLWEESVMSCGESRHNVTYPYRALKSLEVILAEFKRR